MSNKQAIVRVDATYDLMVKVGDKVRRTERLSSAPESHATSAAPVAGTVRSIQFDSERHEFVIVIAPTT
jgi:Na+-translocating ferredoxin:NAD+ oxidoreductase RnfC subunit